MVEQFINIGISGSTQDKWQDPVRAYAHFFDYMHFIATTFMQPTSYPTRLHSGVSDKGGVDIWARDFAEKYHLLFKPHPPNFDLYGRPKAYYVRNKELVTSVTTLFAFLSPSESTDKKSRSGTMMTVREAIKQNKSVYVHTLKDEKFILVWKKLSFFQEWSEIIEK